MGYKDINTLFNEDSSLKERVRKVSEKSNTAARAHKARSAPTYAEIVTGIKTSNNKERNQKRKINSSLNIINPDR